MKKGAGIIDGDTGDVFVKNVNRSCHVFDPRSAGRWTLAVVSSLFVSCCLPGDVSQSCCWDLHCTTAAQLPAVFVFPRNEWKMGRCAAVRERGRFMSVCVSVSLVPLDVCTLPRKRRKGLPLCIGGNQPL